MAQWWAVWDNLGFPHAAESETAEVSIPRRFDLNSPPPVGDRKARFNPATV